MLLSDQILNHRSPLAKVWLAAHYDRKLSKRDIFQASIAKTVQAILADAGDPRALRLSGQLLVGVVRIYSRKAKYLLDECNEAKISIQFAFKPGSVNVDLPGATAGAAHAADRHSSNTATGAAAAARAHLTLADTLAEFDLLLVPATAGAGAGASLGAGGDWADAMPATPQLSLARRADITLADADLLSGPSASSAQAPPTPTLRAASRQGLGSSSASRAGAGHDGLDLDLDDVPMLDLGLDLGLDFGPGADLEDIELGRRAQVDGEGAGLLSMDSTTLATPRKEPTARQMEMDDQAPSFLDLGLDLDLADGPAGPGAGMDLDFGMARDDSTMGQPMHDDKHDQTDGAGAGRLLFDDDDDDNKVDAHKQAADQFFDDGLETLESAAAAAAGNASRKRRRTHLDQATELNQRVLSRMVNDASELVRPGGMAKVPGSRVQAQWMQVLAKATAAGKAPGERASDQIMMGVFALDAEGNVDLIEREEEDEADENVDEVAVVELMRMLMAKRPRIGEASKEAGGKKDRKGKEEVEEDAAEKHELCHMDEFGMHDQQDGFGGMMDLGAGADGHGYAFGDMDMPSMLHSGDHSTLGGDLSALPDPSTIHNGAAAAGFEQPSSSAASRSAQLLIDDDAELARDADAGDDQHNLDTQTGYSKSSIRTIRELQTKFAAINGDAGAQVLLTSMQLIEGKSRAEAARSFYELLLLGTRNLVKVSQDEAYGEIRVEAKDSLFEVGV